MFNGFLPNLQVFGAQQLRRNAPAMLLRSWGLWTRLSVQSMMGLSRLGVTAFFRYPKYPVHGIYVQCLCVVYGKVSKRTKTMIKTFLKANIAYIYN